MDYITGIAAYILSAAGMLAYGAATLLFENSGWLCLWAATVLAFILFYEWRMRRIHRAEGETDAMVSKRRTAQLKSRYADRIHDFLFEMLVSGEITKQEYREAVKGFGEAFDLPDLRTTSKNKYNISHRVKYNCISMRTALKNLRSGRIPGPKPEEYVAPPPVVIEEVFGAKLLARHKKT